MLFVVVVVDKNICNYWLYRFILCCQRRRFFFGCVLRQFLRFLSCSSFSFCVLHFLHIVNDGCIPPPHSGHFCQPFSANNASILSFFFWIWTAISVLLNKPASLLFADSSLKLSVLWKGSSRHDVFIIMRDMRDSDSLLILGKDVLGHSTNIPMCDKKDSNLRPLVSQTNALSNWATDAWCSFITR